METGTAKWRDAAAFGTPLAQGAAMPFAVR